MRKQNQNLNVEIKNPLISDRLSREIKGVKHPVCPKKMETIKLDLTNDWSEGTTKPLKIENKSKKWIFFKVKGTKESTDSTSVVPNKGVINPKSSLVIHFTIKKRHLKRGDTTMPFIVKWNAIDLDQNFQSLQNFDRFSMIALNDVAYKNPKLHKVEDQVNTVVLKFAPYEKQGSENDVKDVEKNQPIRWTFFMKAKVAFIILMVYFVYFLICYFIEKVTNFSKDIQTFSPNSLFPWD